MYYIIIATKKMNKLPNKIRKMKSNKYIYHLDEFNYYTKHLDHLKLVLEITEPEELELIKGLKEDIDKAEKRIDYHYKRIEEETSQ